MYPFIYNFNLIVMGKKKFTSKSYRLLDDRSGLAFMLKVGKTGNLLVFDEEKGFNRPIKHCPNERTIFIDEQSVNALVEPVIFSGGYLEVEPTQQLTQAFLDNHPDNIANGGAWFEEVNEEKEATESVVLDDLKMDIKLAIREKLAEEDGVHQVEAVVAVLIDSVDEAREMSKGEMKRVLYQEAEYNPYYFIDDEGNVTIFNDDSVVRKYFILRAIKDGVIKKTPNSKAITWTRDGSVIATAPRGLELIEYFSDFLSSDEGMLVAEEIKRRS